MRFCANASRIQEAMHPVNAISDEDIFRHMSAYMEAPAS